MPFRLTQQLVNLMQPLRESGLIQSVMVHSLRAYRAEPDLLLNTMDVFVKEPLLDWKVNPKTQPFLSSFFLLFKRESECCTNPSLFSYQNFELKQLKKGGTWMQEVNTKEINWYPLQKVNFARRKLEGANPSAITRCSDLTGLGVGLD